MAKAQRLQTECNKVIDLLIKTGVFRGLKTSALYGRGIGAAVS